MAQPEPESTDCASPPARSLRAESEPQPEQELDEEQKMVLLVAGVKESKHQAADLRNITGLIYDMHAGQADKKAFGANMRAFRACGGFELVELLGAVGSDVSEAVSDVHYECLRCLNNACADTDNRDALRESGVLPRLVELLSSPSDRIQERAAHVLARAVARNETNQILLGQELGASPPLVQLLKSSVPDVQDFTTYALQLFVAQPASRIKLRECDDAGPLLALLVEIGAGDTPGQCRAVLTACEYAESDWAELRHRGWVLRQTEIVSLVAGIKESTDKAADLVKMTGLMYSGQADKKAAEANTRAFRACGGFELVELLGAVGSDVSEAVSDVHYQCLRCICNASAEPDNRDALRESGVLPRLVELLSSPSDRIQKFAAMATVWASTSNNTNQILLGQELGAIPPLVKLLKSSVADVQQRASRALQRLTEASANCITLRECDAAGPLLAVLVEIGAGDTPGQCRAVLTACEYAESDWAELRSKGHLVLHEQLAHGVQELHDATGADVTKSIVALSELLGVRGAREAFIMGGVIGSLVRAVEVETDARINALRLLLDLWDSASAELQQQMLSRSKLLWKPLVGLLQHSEEDDGIVNAACDVVQRLCGADVATKVTVARDLQALQILTHLLTSDAPLRGTLSGLSSRTNSIVRAIGALCVDPQTWISPVWTEGTTSAVQVRKTSGGLLSGQNSSGGLSIWVIDRDHHIRATLRETDGRLEGSYTISSSTTTGTIRGQVEGREVQLQFTSVGTQARLTGRMRPPDENVLQLTALAAELKTAEHLAVLLFDKSLPKAFHTDTELALHALGHTSETEIFELHLKGMVTQRHADWETIGTAERVRSDVHAATCADVCLWLCECGFERSAGLFDIHNVTGSLLLQVTDEELKAEFHFNDLAERKRIRQAIDVLDAYLGRYRLQVGRVVHNSHTSVVIYATDMISGQLVALKFMVDADQYLLRIIYMRFLYVEFVCKYLCKYRIYIIRSRYEREVKIRKATDSLYVVGIIAHQRLDEDASCYDPRLRGRYLLVMERADRDMVDSLAHDGIAGTDRLAVVRIARDIVSTAQYINHDLGYSHGDMKPRNFVETIHADGTTRWKAIDFDAATKHGSSVSPKCSTGFISPQRACRLIDSGDATEDADLAASVSLDMFALGLVLFQLCSTDGSSPFYSNQADNLVEPTDLADLALRWNEVPAPLQ